jgi:hypothetical protein
MKERIKQLWEDSEEIKVRYPEQGSPVSVSEQTLEKFAELIVRRCAAVAYSYDPLEPVPNAIARLIQEHFGVEE